MKMILYAKLIFGLLLTFVTSVAMANSSGTGFFISSDGLVATNFHVIEDAQSITVTRFNGRQSSATPLITDKANDIAILQVQDTTQETFMPVRHSSTVSRGGDLLTIGFPLTSIQGKEPKVTSGILSSLSGLDDDPTHFQISVPVQPGNSGGPLIAKDGAVIGIVTSKLNALGVVKVTGDIPQNVNFAVKSSYLVELFSTRAIDNRIKASYKIGPNIATEEIVRRSLNAVVLINVITPSQSKPSAPVNNAPTPSEVESSTSSLTFGNVEFMKMEGYLEVMDITYNNPKLRTTLRIGDRIVACLSGSDINGTTRVYGVKDLERCKPVKSTSETSQYIYRTLRMGSETIGSIIK